MTVKRLTFVRRADGETQEDFAVRWRERALQLHASAPEGARLQRLVQCVVRLGRSDRAHHGMAVEWFADDDALAAHDRHAADHLGEPVVDPSTVVSARVEARTVFGQDLLDSWWRDPAAGSRLLVIGVVQRLPAMSREAFRDYWWGEHRPLANRLLPADTQPPIYVHNYALPDEDCAWDGVGEFYDPSVDVARHRNQWAETDEAEALRVDEGKFLVRDTRYGLITDAEVVINGKGRG